MRKLSALLCVLALFLSLAGCLPEESPTSEEVQPYSDHVFIGPRDCGDCDTLTGKVLITVVFTDEDDSVWDAKAVSDYQAKLAEATKLLTTDAERYGAKLDISFHYLRSKTSSSVTYSNYEEWSNESLKNAELPEKSLVVSHLKEAFSVKEAPVLFAVNRGGRAFARTQAIPFGFEYAVLHQGEADYRHELLHLFGARDYYYPDEAEKLAKIHLPGSIMNTESGERTVDPLTAYQIGWTDTLQPKAIRFLDATAHITQTDVSEAVKEETVSGNGTFQSEHGTFTGTLVTGLYHGKGKFQWNDGSSYEGDFYYGSATGEGTITWSDGATYTGEVLNWKMHGQGKYSWPNGDSYEGNFEDNKATGHGKYVWANGTTYIGEILDWKLHGEGTCTFEGGQVQSGTWDNNKFIG